jgi:hypothetical protein
MSGLDLLRLQSSGERHLPIVAMSGVATEGQARAPGEGTGLGLWVSYAIAEQHGGRLRAENRPEGGAAFTLDIPVRDRRPDGPAGGPAPAAHGPSARGPLR